MHPVAKVLSRLVVAAIPVGLVALTSLDCGGKVDSPACPSDGTCTSDCKATYSDCSGTFELTCTCDSTGHAQCPELGAPSCQNDCDALLHGSTTCSSEGEKCPAPAQLACLNAPTLYCTCSGGEFHCDPVPDCTQPACPPPSEVHAGAACTGFGLCATDQSVNDCDGNVLGYVECSCVGGTFGDCVSPPTPSCPIDAGSADANTVDAGQAD